MLNTFFGSWARLTWAMVLSSGLALSITPACAHEVQPTIADLTVAEGAAELVMRVNLEALLSGIDLDTVVDTNDAADADIYDALRARPPEEIADQAARLLERWNDLPLLTVDGAPLMLSTVAISVPENVNIELPRISTWELRGEVTSDPQSAMVAWPDGSGALVLRQQGVEAPYTGYIEGGDTTPEINLDGGDAQGAGDALLTYIPVGFDHIIPKGLDHILFVLGLFFLSAHLRPLIWQISAFTLAHTVTLAMGALGWVNVPGSIVEPLIAASIVYVAVENVFHSGLNRWRPLVIFGFGLLHGLGFASVLEEFGLPEGQFIPALIGFNIGVEVGQITVVLVAAACVWWALRVLRGRGQVKPAILGYGVLTVLALAAAFLPWPAAEVPPALFALPIAALFAACGLALQFRDDVTLPYRRFVAVPFSLAIAAVGAYWFIERVFL